MAKIRESQPLIPSVLDRLIDKSPGVSTEPPQSRTQVLSDLKQSVRDDLENLLNTRYRCVGWPEHLKELDTSLVNYGIPDFTSTNLSSAADREAFRFAVERAIRVFEPRFKEVRVHLLQHDETRQRAFGFKIDALLHAEPAPEPIIFDAVLKPDTDSFGVQRTAR